MKYPCDWRFVTFAQPLRISPLQLFIGWKANDADGYPIEDATEVAIETTKDFLEKDDKVSWRRPSKLTGR